MVLWDQFLSAHIPTFDVCLPVAVCRLSREGGGVLQQRVTTTTWQKGKTAELVFPIMIFLNSLDHNSDFFFLNQQHKNQFNYEITEITMK